MTEKAVVFSIFSNDNIYGCAERIFGVDVFSCLISCLAHGQLCVVAL